MYTVSFDVGLPFYGEAKTIPCLGSLSKMFGFHGDGETKILNVAYYSLHFLSPRHYVVLNDESPSPSVNIYIISNLDPKVKNYFT